MKVEMVFTTCRSRHPLLLVHLWPNQPLFFNGPRELTGGVDLISQFKLHAHHSFFCKKSLPSAISETQYLHNVVGDIEIRKGEGMELDQLFQNTPCFGERTTKIHPFELGPLNQAFKLRETAMTELPYAFRGAPTISRKTKDDKERKHKKHKDRDRKKGKEHSKHKHHNKDKDHSKEKDHENKGKGARNDVGGDQSKRYDDKKRKHGGFEDIDNQKNKKVKVKSSNVGQLGRIKIAG